MYSSSNDINSKLFTWPQTVVGSEGGGWRMIGGYRAGSTADTWVQPPY